MSVSPIVSQDWVSHVTLQTVVKWKFTLKSKFEEPTIRSFQWAQHKIQLSLAAPILHCVIVTAAMNACEGLIRNKERTEWMKRYSMISMSFDTNQHGGALSVSLFDFALLL